MSLYNLMFGVNEYAAILLAMLNLSPNRIPRIRDVFIDGEHVVVHTRSGGGNREEYAAEIEGLRAHPLYVKDTDDDFDSTYCNFYFRFPEEWKAELKVLSATSPPDLPSDKWRRWFKENAKSTGKE